MALDLELSWINVPNLELSRKDGEKIELSRIDVPNMDLSRIGVLNFELVLSLRMILLDSRIDQQKTTWK